MSLCVHVLCNSACEYCTSGPGTVDTFVNVFLPKTLHATRSTPEGEDLTTCGTEAPLPARALRDIPDETVKALLPGDNHLLGCDTSRGDQCSLPRRRRFCSSSLGPCFRKDHLSGKDASVKCFDAVLGKVHLPCLRFIAVRNVVFWHPLSLPVLVMFTQGLHCFFLAMRGKNVRASRVFREARQLQLTPKAPLPLPPHVAEVCTVFFSLISSSCSCLPSW